jgi:rod shape-determining protein MreD
VNATSWARLTLVTLVAIVLQVSVFDDITIIGAHADLMIVIAAAAGIAAGPGQGAVIGFVAGCLSDLAVNLPFGFGPLTFVLVGFGSSYLLRAISGRDLPLAELATVALSAAIGTLLYGLIATVVGQHGLFDTAGSTSIFIVGAAGVVLGLPVLAALRWVIEPSATTLGGASAG